MSDGDEVLAGINIAGEEAKKLHEKNTDHELLRLFNAVHDDDIWEEFQLRFGKPGLPKSERGISPAQAYFWASYAVALKEANEEMDK